MRPNNRFVFNKKEVSLVSRAMQEFNKVSSQKSETMTIQNQNLDNDQNSLSRKGANPPKKRSVLGRGLSALMSPTTTIDVSITGDSQTQSFVQEKVASAQESMQTVETSAPAQVVQKDNLVQKDSSVELSLESQALLQFIPIDKLTPNPNQPRTTFDQKEIRELAASIRKSGVLQPLIVRKKSQPTSAFVSYEIVAGERRWRAAKEAGLISVPAVIKEITDQEALEIGIIENIQRQDLNPIEEALAYSRLMNEFGSTQEQLSQIFGKDRSSIANVIRLLSLPEEIKVMLKERKLTSGHARALLTIESADEQIELANILSRDKLTVRDAERLASERKPTSTKSKKSKSAHYSKPQDQALEERLRRALGTKVSVNMSASGKGEVRIAFFSRAEFENFLEKVGA